MPTLGSDKSTSLPAAKFTDSPTTDESTFASKRFEVSGNVSDIRRSIGAAAAQRKHGNAPSTIQVETRNIEAENREVVGSISATRTTTIVPAPAQDDKPTNQNASAFVSSGGVLLGKSVSNAVATDTAPSATLETMPPQVEKKTNAYVEINQEALELKVKAFREQLSLAQSRLSTDVKYDFAKDRMDPKTRAALGEVAKAITMLDALPGLEQHQLTIHGHTDSKAGFVKNDQGQMVPFDNQKLSEQRANDLRDALITMGVKPDRVVAVGHGASSPVAPNEINVGGRMVDNPEGRALNRRAELGFSMGQKEFKAYLLEMDARFERESSAHVTKETTEVLPRSVVEHLETMSSPKAMMAYGGSIETTEQREAREAREATAQEARDLEARRLANALEQVCQHKVDLKIAEYNGQSSGLALRIDKDRSGNYLVSVFNPDTTQTLQTLKYTPSGFESGRSLNGDTISPSAIEDGLLRWAAQQR